MIILKKPYINDEKEKSRLIFDLSIDKEKKSVWFEVDKEYAKYLCDDRIDAILIGILSYAMRNNHDIKTDSYVTEEILYKINNHLIPTLSKYSKNLHQIKINAKTKETVKNSGGVGTGCSCGIDSLHATLKHLKMKEKQFKLTHLTINNVGAFNECYSESGIEKVRIERTLKSKEFAQKVGLPLIITNSNFQTEIPQVHSYTHTYSSTFAVLCLQKLWKTYYYGSSGYDYTCFNIIDTENKDSSCYELLSLDSFSTNNMKIYSEGASQTRFEKTKDIYQNKLVSEYLHVCTKKEINCGICPKCMRTLLTLYALDADFSKYNKVFNIEHFHENKEEYFNWIYLEHLSGDKMNEETYQELLKKDDFREFVASKEEVIEPEVEYNFYKEEYEKVINSKTFKVGNIIMKIPRKLKAFIKKEEKE